MAHEPNSRLPYWLWSRLRRGRRRFFPARLRGPAPALSVVVPMFNVAPYIQDCLGSVLAELGTALEIIVVDDGSRDASRQLAERLARADRRVWVFHQRNRGLGAARNYGMRLAGGAYVAFLDADDVAMPGAYRAMLEAAQAHRADIVAGGLFQVAEGKRHYPQWLRYIHDHDRYMASIDEFPELLRDFYTPNKLIRREWWMKHRLRFREGVMFEDQPVITQAFALARRIAVLRMMVYEWRRREDGTSLTQTMYSAQKIDQRRLATELTRRVVDAKADDAFSDAWIYTLVENHFLTYFRHLPQMDDSARAALVRFVQAAGAEDALYRPAAVSPAAGVLACLAHRGELDAVDRLVDAGWTEAGHVALRGEAGRAALAKLLGDPVLAASLAPCFSGRGIDPQRFIVRTESVEWTAAGDLRFKVRVPFIDIYGLTDARFESIVGPFESPLATANVTPLPDDAVPHPEQSGSGARFEVEFSADDLAGLSVGTPGDAKPCQLGFAIVHGGVRFSARTAVRPTPFPRRAQRTWRRADGTDLLLRWRDRYWPRLEPPPADGDASDQEAD